MKKIKVAHVLNSVGGVDVHLRIILGAFDTQKIESVIIHGYDDTHTPFLDKNGKAVPEFRTTIQRSISPFKDLKALINTIFILKREKPDVIHAHSAKGGIIARAASLWYPATVLYTPHAFSYLSAAGNLKRSLFLGLERIFKHFNSVLVACSESERKRAIEEVGYNQDKALCFNNSIHPIGPSDMLTAGLGLPEKYICTVGRPSYQKNIEMLVEVVRVIVERQKQEYNPSLAPIHLVVLGVGEYSPNKDRVESLVAQYNLEEHITMVPWIDRKQIFSIIDKCELYVSAARYEGLPYSVIEALALGKACVVTNCDGNRDLVNNGYNGYVVQENSVESMANRIFALLKDDGLRQRLGNNSVQYFNSKFNITQTIAQLEAIYKANSK